MSYPVYIQPAPTPNPSAIKFTVSDTKFLDFGGRDFRTRDAAKGSPLAEKLFALEGVGGVFIGTDFVTITEADDMVDWVVLGDRIMDTIRNHLASGEPHLAEKPAGSAESGPADDSLESRIQQVLDTHIRPAVAMDGGDIRFMGVENGIVSVSLVGSCAGCPSSTATLRQGIERMLMTEIPEIEGVIQV